MIHRKFDEKIFVKTYLETRNGRKSALAAGASEASASVKACAMLRKPHIAAAVGFVDQQGAPVVVDDHRIAAVATAETNVVPFAEERVWVIGQLRENHVLARAAEDYSASNRALELIGKSVGAFVDRVEANVNETKSQCIKTVYTPDEIRAINALIEESC